MSSKSSIEELLALARKRRAELKRELEMLDDSISHLQGLLAPKQLTIPQVAVVKSQRFKNSTAVKSAEIVLQEHGKPMHLNNIITAIIEGGHIQKDKNKLYQNLYSAMTRKRIDIFKRTKDKRATFGLREWEQW